MEWNDERDLSRITAAFEGWVAAIHAKDRASIESLHDDGFLVTLPNGTLMDKPSHIELELAHEWRAIDLLQVKTRRLGDILLVWTRHRWVGASDSRGVDMPGAAHGQAWISEERTRNGYVQAEFSVWRESVSGQLKILAIEVTMCE